MASLSRLSYLLLALLTIAFGPRGCSGAGAHASRDAQLDLAFQIASSIPIEPHARDRARMQEVVAQACLDQGMVDQAAKYANRIDGWRQGEMLALIGQHCATDGDSTRARELATQALDVEASDKVWQRERVTTEVAKIYLQLGDESKAYSVVTQSSQAELGKVEATRTASMSPEKLDAQADTFDKAIATLNFDLARGGIDGYLVWLGRVMNDEARRDRAMKALTAAIPGLPVDLQVTYTVSLAELLAKHGQRGLATTQLDRAAQIFTGTNFLAEDLAPLGVTVARAHTHLGDPVAARAELQRLHAVYEARRTEIVDLRRATSLRALAEAYSELGDRTEATRCYAAALEEGALNPNARPRAEDLCATCVSMASSGIEPTPELQRRIDNIRTSLADPW